MGADPAAAADPGAAADPAAAADPGGADPGGADPGGPGCPGPRAGAGSAVPAHPGTGRQRLVQRRPSQ